MEKKTYYVSVQAESVLEEQEAAAYEFEIEATEQDVRKLEELFEQKEDADQATAMRAHIPVIQYHNDEENDAYDAALQEIYQEIYRLGTEGTKQHIEQMGILQKID